MNNSVQMIISKDIEAVQFTKEQDWLIGLAEAVGEGSVNECTCELSLPLTITYTKLFKGIWDRAITENNIGSGCAILDTLKSALDSHEQIQNGEIVISVKACEVSNISMKTVVFNGQ